MITRQKIIITQNSFSFVFEDRHRHSGIDRGRASAISIRRFSWDIIITFSWFMYENRRYDDCSQIDRYGDVWKIGRLPSESWFFLVASHNSEQHALKINYEFKWNSEADTWKKFNPLVITKYVYGFTSIVRFALCSYIFTWNHIEHERGEESYN